MEHLSTYAIILLFLLHCTAPTQGQQPAPAPAAAPVAAPAPAPAPAPPGPTNITAILEKAGQFGTQFATLIRLLKNTQVADRINNQLNGSNSGLTLFAPTDSAFSSLPAGTLNSLTNSQQVTLLQFHIIPSLISMSQFQTVSNPLSTQAGDPNHGLYPLNVTTTGNQVNVSTGLVNTTISNTVYTDDQLAVYQVDKVLLPLGIFRPSAAAPAPSKAGKKGSSPSDGPDSSPSGDSADASDGTEPRWRATAGWLAIAATVSFLL